MKLILFSHDRSHSLFSTRASRCTRSLATIPTSPILIFDPLDQGALSLRDLEQPPPPPSPSQRGRSPSALVGARRAHADTWSPDLHYQQQSPTTTPRPSSGSWSVMGLADHAVLGLRWSKVTTTIAWLRHHLRSICRTHHTHRVSLSPPSRFRHTRPADHLRAAAATPASLSPS